MRFVLIGAGQRGMIYAQYAHEKGHEIVAVAERDPARLSAAREAFGVPGERCFASAAQLLALPKLGDAAIVATMDRDHYAQAIPALEKGYHLLLEKPISPIPEQFLEIEATARRLKRHVAVCHVLRYAPFFMEIKRLIDEGAIGRVVTIQHNENIGSFHFAHSFVRGNWRRKADSSPLIMQKSCHDMDLLVWLVGSGCRRVASFGDLTCFRRENAPAGSSERCAECALRDTCRYSAPRCYLPIAGSWPATVLCGEQSEAALTEAIKTGPYGRCVYRCDNDVCDHQVTVLEFDNGVTATFNLSAFTDKIARTLKIMGERGELRANETTNTIEVIPFAANALERTEARLIHPAVAESGHSGGDAGIVESFLKLIGGGEGEAATAISRSVESHLMACAAEEARVSGTVVDIADFRRRHEGNAAV